MTPTEATAALSHAERTGTVRHWAFSPADRLVLVWWYNRTMTRHRAESLDAALLDAATCAVRVESQRKEVS